MELLHTQLPTLVRIIRLNTVVAMEKSLKLLGKNLRFKFETHFCFSHQTDNVNTYVYFKEHSSC